MTWQYSQEFVQFVDNVRMREYSTKGVDDCNIQ